MQARIIADYKELNPRGHYKYTLREIAERHEISLSAVNNLVRTAKCQGRPKGGRFKETPSPRIMKILRDASEPFITLEEVGRRNPRVVVRRGKSKKIPLSKQRVAQIIKMWKDRVDKAKLHSKGFNPGDEIVWAGQHYIVVRYDSPHRGAVVDLAHNEVIDPFCWVYDGERSKRIKAATEEMTPKEVKAKYIRREPEPEPESEPEQDSEPVDGTPD
jgi:hypothetical protein